MWKNYLASALRNLVKYRLFAAINIGGLAVGLAALILTVAVVEHETGYDSFFPNHERIHAVYGDLRPEAGFGVRTMDGVHAAVRPLLDQYVPEIELSARSVASELVVRAGDDVPFYQQVRFVDPEFLTIFAFEYLDGTATEAFSGPTDVILSETAARRYFDEPKAVGRTLSINGRMDVRVAAVIRDLPGNSHFTSSMLPPGLFNPKFEMLAPMDAYRSLGFGEPDENWGNINPWDPTYVLLREGADRGSAEEGLARLYDAHFSGEARENFARLGLRPLTDLSQYIWNAAGLPVPQSVRIVGILILGIAILNYGILATAQAMGRNREMGLRKCLGAGRSQLASQMLVESVLQSALALIVALAAAELVLPGIGDALGQDIHVLGDAAFGRAALIAVITLGTGLLAGLYPALRISRLASMADLLGDGAAAGGGRSRLTNVMIGLQFLVASALGGIVLVIMAQNGHIRAAAGATFNHERIVTLDRIRALGSVERYETLKQELLAIPDVEAVALVSQVPYEQGTRTEPYARALGEKSSAVTLLQLWGDHDLLRTLGIRIVAGRDFSPDFADDRLTDENHQAVNVVLNETAVRQMGWASPREAIGETIRLVDKDEPARTHRIVGVSADVNYLGLHNRIWPSIFVVRPERASFFAIRLREAASPATGQAIDAAWHRLAPDAPVVRKSLGSYFDELFDIFFSIGAVLAFLAGVALFLSAAGLFGLAAYVTERRRREIGIRKVLGATVGGLVRLMLWQMSRPVLVALVLAMPVAWLAATLYLDFFSDRIAGVPFYLAATALAALMVAGMAVTGHALRAANLHPASVLHVE